MFSSTPTQKAGYHIEYHNNGNCSNYELCSHNSIIEGETLNIWTQDSCARCGHRTIKKSFVNMYSYCSFDNKNVYVGSLEKDECPTCGNYYSYCPKCNNIERKVGGNVNFRCPTCGTQYEYGTAYCTYTHKRCLGHSIANTYYIKFNENGGSGSMQNQTFTYDSAKNLTANNFSAPNGKYFVGWSLSSSSNLVTYSNQQNVKNLTTINNEIVNLYAIWNLINYTITYNLDGGSANNKSSYNIETNTFTLSNPTKNGYTFIGWTGSNGSTKQTSVSIAKGSTGNKSYTANYSINQYDVTYIDVVDSINGTQLGKTTKKVNYNFNVRGSDLGSNTSDNAYYNGYYYSSDTSATVSTSGATVYRIFKLRTIDKTSNLTWNDNNNKNGFRPSKYTLKLLRNGSLFKQVELTSSQTSYTFSNLTKYDSKGNAFKYNFEVDASDRYKITLDTNGNTITENYQNSTFSVTIPKTISLNGLTGKGNYNVKVNGTFYYNDTLTVTPSNSFTLKDKNNINTLQTNVTQTTTSFTKNNLGSTSGSISLNKTKFAGKYDGTFNFNIKFVMKN